MTTIQMTTNDYQWLPCTDYQWLPMTTNDYHWLTMTTNDYQWLPMTNKDYQKDYQKDHKKQNDCLIRCYHSSLDFFVFSNASPGGRWVRRAHLPLHQVFFIVLLLVLTSSAVFIIAVIANSKHYWHLAASVPLLLTLNHHVFFPQENVSLDWGRVQPFDNVHFSLVCILLTRPSSPPQVREPTIRV